MSKAKLGEQESALLAWIAGHSPVSAADVVKGFGAANGLARTTVTTMLERLRTKGYLTRQKKVYAPHDEHQEQSGSRIETRYLSSHQGNRARRGR